MQQFKFKVKLVGAFHSNELYDDRGREIFHLADAVKAAEAQFGAEWEEVYNGEEGMVREEVNPKVDRNRALALTLELAEDNALSEDDASQDPSILIPVRAEQLEAFRIVREIIQAERIEELQTDAGQTSD